jgi:ATP-binding cassette subfamily C protein
LEEIARASRIRLRRVVLEEGWWKRDVGDLLAFSRDDERRPLALLRTRSLSYVILDPRSGRRTGVDARSAATLAPEAVMPYRSLPERPLALLDLLRFSVEHRTRDLLYVLATGLAASALGLLVPQATALLMDQGIPEADRRLSLELGAGLLAAALGQCAFQLARGFALLRVGTLSESESQAALWDRLLCLRPTFFRRFSSGDLQSRVDAVGDVGRALGSATLSLLFSGSVVLLNLALLGSYDAGLAAVAMGIGALVAACTLLAGARIRASTRRLLEVDGRFYGLVVQLVRGVAKLRVAGAGERAFAHWLTRLTRVLELVQEASRRSQWLVLFNQAVPVLSSMLLFVLAHERIQAARAGGLDGLSLGTFLGFASAFGVFLAGVGDLSDTLVGLLDLSATTQRVAPILVEVPESAGNKREPGTLSGAIGMERVSFSYGKAGPRVLDGLSLSVEPGQFAAVVGTSGSGKSTLLRLLLGFELPDSGVVRYDGHDLAELDASAVRRQLGVVLQGGRLDAGSIFENISGGAPISLDEAWSAAEDAGIADEIHAMPMGMHTLLSSGGGNLSGGQRQRLLIARALVRRPRVLFLDEATSALDNRTQAVIARSLERSRATRFVIAHRLSTIRGADRIFVLEGGRVAQQGTFGALAAETDGLFARLIERQSG